MNTYILDTSALLTLRNQEEGTDQVEEILRKGKERQLSLFASFITYTEVFYIVWQKQGRGEAYKAYLQFKMLPIQRVDPSEELFLLAGELKAEYPISLGDSFIAATALQEKGILVHKDPEFESLNDRLEFLTLPYKSKKKSL